MPARPFDKGCTTFPQKDKDSTPPPTLHGLEWTRIPPPPIQPFTICRRTRTLHELKPAPFLTKVGVPNHSPVGAARNSWVWPPEEERPLQNRPFGGFCGVAPIWAAPRPPVDKGCTFKPFTSWSLDLHELEPARFLTRVGHPQPFTSWSSLSSSRVAPPNPSRVGEAPS